MSSRSDKAFAKIAQDMLRAAEQVRCSIAEYAEGLRGIREELQDRISIADEEAGR